MKKYFYILLILLLMPILVNAETLEYNICKNGCEYDELSEVLNILTEMSNNLEFNGQDIIINITDNESYDLTDTEYIIANEDRINDISSITINGNNAIINNNNDSMINFAMSAQKITINNLNIINTFDNDEYANAKEIPSDVIDKLLAITVNSELVEINNCNIPELMSMNGNIKIRKSKINVVISDSLNIDDSDIGFIWGFVSSNNYVFNNSKITGFIGDSGDIYAYNVDMTAHNCIFRNGLFFINSNVNIYDSNIVKIVNYHDLSNASNFNIYNSKLNGILYANPNTDDEAQRVLGENFEERDPSTWHFNILDIHADTYVHFDDTITLKPGETIDLKDKFGFDNDDLWSLEDNIGDINGNILTATKVGKTKLILNADEEHFLYNINLVVEKETIPEKIDKMTIKVPITGSKVKVWVVVVSILLLVVTLVCSYLLIKNKKH